MRSPFQLAWLVVGLLIFFPACNGGGDGISTESDMYWANAYGGPNDDDVSCIEPTADGGFIMAGETHSWVGDDDHADGWVVKLRADGSVAWEKTYDCAGAIRDGFYSVQQTDDDGDGQADDGYIVAGSTHPAGEYAKVWILKLDADGNATGEGTWQKTYGGADSEPRALTIQQTADGGYIAAGDSASDVGLYSILILKLDGQGNVDWQKTYGGDDNAWPYAVRQTDDDGDGQADDGYIVVGSIHSLQDPFGSSAWVLKLDGDGTVDWEYLYPSYYTDAWAVQQTSDGGYIVAGYDHVGAWVLKLHVDGSVDWQRAYGGDGSEGFYSVRQTDDGGYVLAGWSRSFSGASRYEAWMVKLTSGGEIVWQNKLAGNGSSIQQDTAMCIREVVGGYVVAGKTYSYGAGGSEAWAARLNENGLVPGCGAISTTTGSDYVTYITLSATGIDGVESFLTAADTSVTPADSHATVTPIP